MASITVEEGRAFSALITQLGVVSFSEDSFHAAGHDVCCNSLEVASYEVDVIMWADTVRQVDETCSVVISNGQASFQLNRAKLMNWYNAHTHKTMKSLKSLLHFLPWLLLFIFIVHYWVMPFMGPAITVLKKKIEL